MGLDWKFISGFFIFISLVFLIMFIDTSDKVKDIEIAKEKYDIVLVDFYGNSCPPCRKVSPIIDEIKIEYTNIKVLKINIEEMEDVSDEYNITHIPTVIIFYKGEEFTRLVGSHEKSEYIYYIEYFMNKDDDRAIRFKLN